MVASHLGMSVARDRIPDFRTRQKDVSERLNGRMQTRAKGPQDQRMMLCPAF